jgi:hypothetical protein
MDNEIFTSATGIEIHTSTNLLEFDVIPTRKFIRKRWMRTNYFLRIQKKWNKRYGYTEERFFARVHGMIIAHPNNIDFVLEHIQGRR